MRELASKHHVACSLLGKAELVGAFHRKFRDSEINQKELATLIEQFEAYMANLDQATQQIRQRQQEYRQLLDEQYRSILSIEHKNSR